MSSGNFGEFTALLTAVFWTVTALVFEVASKRIGALPVNLFRLGMGYVIYTVFGFFSRGMFFPTDAPSSAWLWLSLSGLVGFVLGDQCLLLAYIRIGARVSMLIMASVPPLTAILSRFVLHETLTGWSLFAMFLTIGGIALVVLTRKNRDERGMRNGIRFNYPLSGILLAFGAAIGQAGGLVLSKLGMGSYDAFASSQIRVLSGMIGFALLITVMRRWAAIRTAAGNGIAWRYMVIGSVFGPFLGVSFSLLAIQNTSTGIASTIMALVPVLIIPPAVIFMKEKVTLKEVIGSIIAITGVALLFLK